MSLPWLFFSNLVRGFEIRLMDVLRLVRLVHPLWIQDLEETSERFERIEEHSRKLEIQLLIISCG